MAKLKILPAILVVILILLGAYLLFYFYSNVIYSETHQLDAQEPLREIPIKQSVYFKSFPANERITKPVYIIPYVGDIDGDVSEEWFFFINGLVEFYDRNEIPAAFSFYPDSMAPETRFMDILIKMYNSPYIEMMHKSYLALDDEYKVNELPSDVKTSIKADLLKAEQEAYIENMHTRGIKNPKLPLSYTKLGGRATLEDREALDQVGYKMYFDVYYDESYGNISSKEDFYVIQYGVSFTEDGGAGAETTFRLPDEIIEAINTYNREDVTVLSYKNIPIIPLWTHQQDFESKNEWGNYDTEKWDIYQETLLRLKQDPNVIFVTPSDVYSLLSEQKLR